MTFVKSGAVRSLLSLVAKPGRYAGPLTSANPGRFATARIRVAVVHPDHFENGLTQEVTRASFRALESVLGVAADLVFLPWSDLDERLSARGAAPWGIESGAPLDSFDLLLFTPATALQYVHLPRLLARAGIPATWERRAEAGNGGALPLVAAIGPLLANPLPLADLVDCVFLGEPEGVLPGVARALAALSDDDARSAGRRETMLAAIESLPGVARTDREFGSMAPALGSESMLALTDPLILPLVEATGEGLRLSIRLGSSGERFRHVWRPAESTWLRPADEALASVDRVLKETGLERIDLVGDAPRLHPAIQSLVESINRRFPGVRIGLDDFGLSEPRPALAREILRGKRGPVVMSPWAAMELLRTKLGIAGTNDMLIEAAATALRGGAIPITFRFGIGWPGETDADRAEIVQLMKRIRAEAVGAQPTRFVIELVPFIPQPGSNLAGAMPYGGLDLAQVTRELSAALEAIGPCQVRTPPADLVAIEAYLTNGGREVGAALIRSANAGATTPDPIHPWQGEPWVAAIPALFENGGASAPAAAAATRGASFAFAPPLVMTETPDQAESSTENAPTVATSDDPAGYGRKSRRKGPVSSRPASRYRLRFAKTELLITTSHLDVGRMFERALRRLERSRMAWHNKSVKLSFGPPLPLGWTSEDEYVDLQFADDVPESMPAAIGEVLNEGLLLLEVSPIRSSVESLAHAIDRAHYMIDFDPEFLESSGGRDHAEWQRRLTDGVARIKLAREILVRKKPEDEIPQVDVRPGVLAALLFPGEGPVSQLHLHLTLGVPGSVRPEALLPHLLADDHLEARLARIHRRSLRIAGAGREWTPLEVVELDFPWWRESPRRSAAGGPRA